ncbi:MFS transporter [Daejeonella lutea]|uniref:MFS transporter, ACS family, hexuronate transporter n=1 Tax=Daejeonella lutea TaxID=572036 RepID=A0A1T5AC89_9SPHI|nr:MFS transporter [Daejeonella lutea]SKB32439.1 MFS transporter, ACS family, hexuronate transporter [Daejeonella lutea]
MKIKNYRWIIVSLLFTGTVINYLDRQVIGLLKPTLEAEFSWSESDFGSLMSAFSFAYAIGLLISGKFIDKVGTKIGYSVAVVVWSVAGMLHAAARSVTGFGIARAALGIGEAGNFPAAVKAVSEWFPRKERALATGIFNSGTAVGSVVALILVPLIMQSYGWQGVFVITGALGFIWLAFWLFFYEIPSRQKRLTKDELLYIEGDKEDESGTQIQAKSSASWVKLFSLRQTWAVITGKLLIDPIFWFFGIWLPSYFSAAFNLNLKVISWELMTIYAATTVGSIAGGYFSSVLIKNGWPTLKARKGVLLIVAILELIIMIAIARFVTDKWVAVGLIAVAVAVHQAWATNVFTMASDMFPKEVVSSVVGIAGMSGAVGGILFPLLVGKILDIYKAGGNLTGGYNVIFTICGITYLVAWTIIHLLTRRAPKIEKLAT